MKDGTNQGRPWRMLLPLFAVIVIGMVWSAYWFIAMDRLRQEVDGQRRRLAESGRSLACATEAWAGYPFRFEFTCMKPTLHVAQIAVSAAQLRAVAQAYNPWHVLLLWDGPTDIVEPGGSQFAVEHGQVLLSLQFKDSHRPLMSGELTFVRWAPGFEARNIQIHTRPEDAGRTGLAIYLSDIELSLPNRPALSIDQANLVSSMRLGWELEVHAIDLRKGDLTYKGKGIVGLDPIRRLSGRLHTETNDLDGLLANVRPFFNLTDQQITAIKAVFGLLGKGSEVDLIARDGEFYIGPFKMGDLSPVY